MIEQDFDEDKYISGKLIAWYDDYKRDLPWRETSDPYLIWISEIILQQTRVNQGYDYYLRFVNTFPDVQSLANASADQVLKLWQGLGYYSRARNLHDAAKQIKDDYNGNFPTEYKDIIGLKGVGEYTAAAIASFAYNLPYAVVDGNVFRVLSRLFAIDMPIDSSAGKKYFTKLANQLIDRGNPGEYNQAIMDFGALQCVPVYPECSVCPLDEICLASSEDKAMRYPVKKTKPTVKERYFNFLDIQYKDFTYIYKRQEKDIWQNLYELPLIESEDEISIEELQESELYKEIVNRSGDVILNPIEVPLKHILSHRIIHAKFYKLTITRDAYLKKKYIKVKKTDVPDYAVSRLIDRYYEHCNK